MNTRVCAKCVCVFVQVWKYENGWSKQGCFVLLLASLRDCIKIRIRIRWWLGWDKIKVCLTLLYITCTHLHLNMSSWLRHGYQKEKKEERHWDKCKERDRESKRKTQQLISRLIWHLQLHPKYQNIWPKFSYHLCWPSLSVRGLNTSIKNPIEPWAW